MKNGFVPWFKEWIVDKGGYLSWFLPIVLFCVPAVLQPSIWSVSNLAIGFVSLSIVRSLIYLRASLVQIWSAILNYLVPNKRAAFKKHSLDEYLGADNVRRLKTVSGISKKVVEAVENYRSIQIVEVIGGSASNLAAYEMPYVLGTSYIFVWINPESISSVTKFFVCHEAGHHWLGNSIASRFTTIGLTSLYQMCLWAFINTQSQPQTIIIMIVLLASVGILRQYWSKAQGKDLLQQEVVADKFALLCLTDGQLVKLRDFIKKYPLYDPNMIYYNSERNTLLQSNLEMALKGTLSLVPMRGHFPAGFLVFGLMSFSLGFFGHPPAAWLTGINLFVFILIPLLLNIQTMFLLDKWCITIEKLLDGVSEDAFEEIVANINKYKDNFVFCDLLRKAQRPICNY